MTAVLFRNAIFRLGEGQVDGPSNCIRRSQKRGSVPKSLTANLTIFEDPFTTKNFFCIALLISTVQRIFLAGVDTPQDEIAGFQPIAF